MLDRINSFIVLTLKYLNKYPFAILLASVLLSDLSQATPPRYRLSTGEGFIYSSDPSHRPGARFSAVIPLREDLTSADGGTTFRLDVVLINKTNPALPLDDFGDAEIAIYLDRLADGRVVQSNRIGTWTHEPGIQLDLSNSANQIRWEPRWRYYLAGAGDINPVDGEAVIRNAARFLLSNPAWMEVLFKHEFSFQQPRESILEIDRPAAGRDIERRIYSLEAQQRIGFRELRAQIRELGHVLAVGLPMAAGAAAQLWLNGSGPGPLALTEIALLAVPALTTASSFNIIDTWNSYRALFRLETHSPPTRSTRRIFTTATAVSAVTNGCAAALAVLFR